MSKSIGLSHTEHCIVVDPSTSMSATGTGRVDKLAADARSLARLRFRTSSLGSATLWAMTWPATRFKSAVAFMSALVSGSQASARAAIAGVISLFTAYLAESGQPRSP